MKINNYLSSFAAVVLMLLLASCKTNNLPKVVNPTYESYSSGDEKGYYVDFEVSHDTIPASAVIINNIKQNIGEDSKNGLKYNVNVIAQSRKLFGFKPAVVESPNGVFFKTDTADVFKEVDFKLKNK